ncbi:DUF1338 domain-containing protein [Elysia marginata]|uniref:2-oxoadipate dioxygenase/decarboxylase n=1 Tax=Elysia marginata TaxID=1093978 RepID=A0AAV4JYX8_9GAST|nr:DUF1338 domain-containing protein [Elysia marginata]
MRRYKQRVPDVNKILDAMVGRQMIDNHNNIQNDHIAFRTMGVPQLGIQSLEKIFLHYGYVRQDAYYFSQKKLDANWYAPPYEDMPRIFISELRVEDLSKNVRDTIMSYTDEVKTDPINNINIDSAQAVDDFLHDSLWRLPDYRDFSQLREESEYASWVIYNRYYLNHYTISVHELPAPYGTLSTFNDFLESIGIVLNDSGGKIKTSADGLLLQSSTVSKLIDAKFADGRIEKISGSYVEFAERKVLHKYASLDADKIKRIHRREGFEANNADKIFESTYSDQTCKTV